MTKTIVITSGKGGVGKTNISVNTALELSKRDYRTCLFDADFGLANVDILLGLRPELTLDDCIFGEKKLQDIILRTKTGIDIIPGSSGIEKVANLPPAKIKSLVSSFSQLTDYDYFLIDTSSGISRGVISCCLASSETIVVITSEATSLIDAYSLVKVMAKKGYKGTVKVVVNKCPDVLTSKRTYLRFRKTVGNHLDVDIAPAGIVLHDPNFETALKHQEPLLTLYPDSIGSQCIRSMVSILLNSDTPEAKTSDFGEFWKRYFDFSSDSLGIPEDLREESKSVESSIVEPPKEKESSSLRPPEPEPEPEPEREENHRESLLQIPDEKATETTNTQIQPELTERKREASNQDILPVLEVGAFTIDTLNLPSPIPLLSKCLDLQSRGALPQSKLFETFSCDPALMLKALGMRSQSLSPKPRRIASIRQILNQIGSETLSNLLTKVTMQEALAEPSETDTHFVNLFWYHSYTTAVVAQNLAAIKKYPYPEEAFLAGLIHDIGRLALQTNFPGTYIQAPLIFTADPLILKEEEQSFGNHHAEVGAASIRNLRLNSFIADAARYHTEPESIIKTAFDLVKIVFVASRLAELQQENEERALQLGTSILEISATQLKDCIAQSREKVTQTADRYQISLLGTQEAKVSENERALFKRQAVDYTLLQGILPQPQPTRDLAQIIKRIHQGLRVLFGIKHALCLMPDEESSCLQAVGYPNCVGWEILSDISLSFESNKSAIVQSFSSSAIQIVLEGEAPKGLSLADQQIIHYLDSDGLACVPMVVDGESLGMIIFGIERTEQNRVHEQQGKLQQFGAQSARSIIAVEQITRHGKDDRSPAHQNTGNFQDDLLN